MIELIIFGVIQFFAAILSGAAGGGFIIAPLLIIFGLPPATAIATAKMGGVGLGIGTSSKFYGKKLASKKMIIVFSLIGIITAILGSFLLIELKDKQDFLQKAVGLVILFIGIPMIYLKNMGLQRKNRSRPIKIIGTLLIGISNIFHTLLSTGISIVQMTIFMSFFGMTALGASATRRAMQLTSALVSLGILIPAGLINYRFGIVSLLSALVGGYVGAHLAVEKGDKFVVNMMALTSAALAVYIILG
jgi:hypothetical protein